MNAEPTGAADSTGEQESTKAADAAEPLPTQAADAATEGETQSIHAWALADDEGDTDLFHRRSWKIPAAVAAAAVAIATGIGVGAVIWSHRHPGSASPSVQHDQGPPAPPPLPQDPDAKFIALYKRHGYDGREDQAILNIAHRMRDELVAGLPKDGVAEEFQMANPEAKPKAGMLLVDTVIDAYHPQPSPDPDARYAALMRLRGGSIVPGHEHGAADEAREACKQLSSGQTFGQLINNVVAGSPGMSRYAASLFADTSVDVFCPQYAGQK
jgi:hypothetical protein